MANISETSINRPVLSTVMMLVILLFGFIGYRFLGVREFPSVDQPIISVNVSYPGANADVIMNQITDASDEQRAGIEQVNQAIGQMDQVTQQNASLVEEAAAATDQLASQADRLTGLVAVFNVKEHVEAVTEVGRSQAVPVVS